MKKAVLVVLPKMKSVERFDLKVGKNSLMALNVELVVMAGENDSSVNVHGISGDERMG